MADSIFISSTDQDSGSSIIALGLIGAFRETVGRLAYMKPIGLGSHDQSVEVIRSAYQFRQKKELMCPFEAHQAVELIANGKQEELLSKVEESFEAISKNRQLVILEGRHQPHTLNVFDIEMNANIAGRLGSQVLLVARGQSDGKTDIDTLVETVKATKSEYEERNCSILGVVVNRVKENPLNVFEEKLQIAFTKANIKLFGVIPNLDFLLLPKLDQIADVLKAEVLAGEEFLTNVATQTMIAAMKPRNFIKYLHNEWALMITPGDRHDILLAIACAQKSHKRRSVSGVILTGGFEPDPGIMSLIDDMDAFNFPLLKVKQDTFETAHTINNLDVRLRPDDEDKIHLAATTVWHHIKHNELWKAFNVKEKPTKAIGSAAFLHRVLEKAKRLNQHIVFPEGDEPRTIKAVSRLLSEKICKVTLLGNIEVIKKEADTQNVNIDEATLIDPENSEELLSKYIKRVVKLRKNKRGGITPDVAKEWIGESTIHFGTIMVQCGDADGLISGAVHSTADTIRPALRFIRVSPKSGIASSVFFMALKDKVLVYGDCAIIPNPNTQELAQIAIESAKTASAFGIIPYVAMLSYSTGKSGKGESVDKVLEATNLVKERIPNFHIDGPIQYDAAIDPEVAKKKQPNSIVAGKASVFIFPDLDAGNIAYKAVQRSAGAIAIGPVLQGLNKPVNDLSRGCSVDDIVYTAAITAIQAGIMRKSKKDK